MTSGIAFVVPSLRFLCTFLCQGEDWKQGVVEMGRVRETSYIRTFPFADVKSFPELLGGVVRLMAAPRRRTQCSEMVRLVDDFKNARTKSLEEVISQDCVYLGI
jgi:hypothetical protein